MHEPSLLSPRCWAVIPAAGHSRRMGRPKLLLDVGGRTVIAQVVDALQRGGVDQIHILVRAEDLPLQAALQSLSVEVHRSDRDTLDMRESVALLLDHLSSQFAPQPGDGWLLCPADHPVLSAAVISSVRSEGCLHPGQVVVPTYQGRRGHPTWFPWRAAELVPAIPAGMGLNWLLQQPDIEVHEVLVQDPSILRDLDTPEDYAQLNPPTA